MEEKDYQEAIKELSKQIGAPEMEVIDENSTFEFSCKRCGACCMNRSDIVLSPLDVYKAAKYLNITTADFLKDYCSMHVGHNSFLPVFTMGLQKNGFCHFLEMDETGLMGCKINPAKPGACASHPLGVMTDCKNNNLVIIKTPQCEASKINAQPQPVKPWMTHVLDHKEDYILCHELQLTYVDILDVKRFMSLAVIILMNEKEEDIPEPIKETLTLTAEGFRDAIDCYFASYINYAFEHFDTSKPFAEQAKANKEELVKVANTLNSLYNFFKDKAKIANLDLDEKIDGMIDSLHQVAEEIVKGE